MRDWRGNTVKIGDRICWVTLKGHKPIMHIGWVVELNGIKIKVRPEATSLDGTDRAWSVPTEKRDVWLHNSENFVVMTAW